MEKGIQTHVILLRAIGPATHKLMGMADWRAAAQDHGFGGVETLVNTGNMIADFDGDAQAAAMVMQRVLTGFGLGDNVVPILRSPAQLVRMVEADPLAASRRPAETAVFFFRTATPDFDWLGDYDGPERSAIFEHHLVVDFTHGSAKAGRLLRLIDKAGGVNTARNWNSVCRIASACRTRLRG